jgi:DNA-binding Lrp family transcriptional regulator
MCSTMPDKKDAAIIEALKQNGRWSTQQIARKTGIPITTVHNRIKKLEKEGVIKGFTVVLDNKKIGRPVAAYILVTVDYKYLKEKKMSQYELAQKLKSNSNVEEAAMVTGASDIIIKVRVSDMDELNDFVTKYLRNVDGIEKTQTAVILNEA